MTLQELAQRIEHTLLKPEATQSDVSRLCDEALMRGFIGVCVNPIHVAFAVERIAAATKDMDRRPVVVSVAGFPLGATHSATKADEADRALSDGALEIDMVVDIGALCRGDGPTVRRGIEAVAQRVRGFPGALLKVILETGALSKEQIILGCRCCAEAQADFVKTSTGMHSSGGATVESVALMHRTSVPIRVKAAGGIRSAAAALAMIEAGAARIGTSSGCAIVDEYAARFLE